MKKTRRLARPQTETPPRLIYLARELEACKKSGCRKPWLEEEFERLCRDPGQCFLVRRWEARRSQFRALLELDILRHEAIDNALKRKDLTASEGLRLHQALTEEFTKEEAFLQLEQHALHSSGREG